MYGSQWWGYLFGWLPWCNLMAIILGWQPKVAGSNPTMGNPCVITVALNPRFLQRDYSFNVCELHWMKESAKWKALAFTVFLHARGICISTVLDMTHLFFPHFLKVCYLAQIQCKTSLISPSVFIYAIKRVRCTLQWSTTHEITLLKGSYNTFLIVFNLTLLLH